MGESQPLADDESAGLQTPLPEYAELSADNEVALELTLWNSVKDGGPDELASYLEHYPEGTFASLAHTRQDAAEEGRPEGEAAADPLDVAFWDAIKESQTPQELAAYLDQHPDGHFAGLARARLSQPIDEAPLAQPEPASAKPNEEAIELAFWESIDDRDDPRLFAAYLEKYPEGAFAVIARARLEGLRGAGGC